MNYAKAAKGKSTHNFLREIDCQSEVELGRCLNPDEKALLCLRFPPALVTTRINKVHNFQSFPPLTCLFFSMAMVH